MFDDGGHFTEPMVGWGLVAPQTGCDAANVLYTAFTHRHYDVGGVCVCVGVGWDRSPVSHVVVVMCMMCKSACECAVCVVCLPQKASIEMDDKTCR